MAGKSHCVEQLECVDSVAAKYGISSSKILAAAENDGLKKLRGDLNVLCAGDVIFVPIFEAAHDSASTEKRHRFRLIQDRVPLRIILEDVNGAPLANLRYTLTVGDERFDGQTSSKGLVDHFIKATEQSGQLTVDLSDTEEERREIFKLAIGALDPISEVTGLQARLSNLGFSPGLIDGTFGPKTQAAMQEFQKSVGLASGNSIDEITERRLNDEHGI